MSRSCHSESVFALAWESVFPDKRERIATTSLRTGFAMTARKRFTAKKGINPVLRTGFIPSATGSGHVITCTARRWVVSGQLYCFQLPPAKGRREACKPFTDPTSRITNVRIKRATAHRSKFSFGIFSARPASAPLPLISATVEVGAFIFQSKSGSAQRSRDRKEAAGGMKRRTDSHASDVGHWLGMTPLRGVRGDVGIAPYGRSIEGAGV